MTVGPDSAFCKNCGSAVQPATAGSSQTQIPFQASPQEAQSSQPPQPPQPPQAPVYDRPAPVYSYGQTPPAEYEDTAPLGVGQFLLMMFIAMIPVVGFIMQLIWAFGGSTNINRRNFARAALILSVIAFVLAIVFGGLFIALISIVRSNYNSF